MPKNIVKLAKRSSYSYAVTIPKEIIDKYGWKSKRKLLVEDMGRRRVEIRDWKG